MRRPYNVGARKIRSEDRDVAHAILTPADDRGFYDIIGADDDPSVPLGADVTYRVELTDEEAAQFRAASNCRYVELDEKTTSDSAAVNGEGRVGSDELSIPSASTMAYMRAVFPGADDWHGRDVPVAILDGGTTTAVRDFMGWTLVARKEFQTDPVGGDEITSEHGCLVAPNGVPAGGMILDAIISDDDGTAAFSASAAAMRWAADNGAKIVNYSFSGASSSQTLLDAIVYLRDRGVQLFCSAGNDGLNQLNFPSSQSRYYPNVHSSVAFDQGTDTRASFSNYHLDASGCAPGNDVLSLEPDATVITWDGTSASTPHMASLCARICTGGQYTAAQAAGALESSARDTGQTIDEQGNGAWSMEAALTLLGALDEPATPTTRYNLCDNPSLEVNATGHTLGSVRTGKTSTAVGTSSTVTAASGTAYGFVNVTGDASTHATDPDVTVNMPTCLGVEEGANYTFSVHARQVVTGTTMQWYVRWEDDVATNLGEETTDREPLFTTQWTRYYITATAPAGATRAVLQLWLSNIVDPATRSFRWDALLYEQNDDLAEYFDGDTSGAVWDGTADNSTSTYSPPPEASPTNTRGFLVFLG